MEHYLFFNFIKYYIFKRLRGTYIIYNIMKYNEIDLPKIKYLLFILTCIFLIKKILLYYLRVKLPKRHCHIAHNKSYVTYSELSRYLYIIIY